MVHGYVSQVKPYKSTGDCVIAVEVLKENWLNAASLNLENVVVLTDREYADLISLIPDPEMEPDSG